MENVTLVNIILTKWFEYLFVFWFTIETWIALACRRHFIWKWNTKKEFIISKLWWLPPEHFVKFGDKNCQKSWPCFHGSWFKRSPGFPFVSFFNNADLETITDNLFSGNFNQKASNSKPAFTFKTMCFWSPRYCYTTSSSGKGEEIQTLTVGFSADDFHAIWKRC